MRRAWSVVREQNPDGSMDLVAPLTYLDWKQQSASVPDLAAFRQLRYAFAGNGEPLDVPSVRATPNLFAVLRANAMLDGRSRPTKARRVRIAWPFSADRSGSDTTAARPASSAGRSSSMRSLTA